MRKLSELLAAAILQRDKEREGDVVITTSTTSDAVAVENRPALREARLLSVCGVAPPRRSFTMSRRRALHTVKIRASKSPVNHV